MLETPPVPGPPAVSVIVPARNEEASLGACLQSLVCQKGLTFEITVVNDGSSDRTSDIARSFGGVRVIESGSLPPGWTGKNSALIAGAREARAPWLLFTDADTVHLPGSLTRAVAEAEEQGAALLSYSPAQEVHGFWETAVVPVIFAELAATYPPSRVSDPDSSVAAANGQYLLISRAAYDAVGGHAAVATSLLEDVALARAVKASGRKIHFRFGGDAVRTRMYRTFLQLKEGWTKNLVLLFPSAGRLALWRFLEFVLNLACVVLLVIAVGNRDWGRALLYLAVPVVTVGRISRAHFPWGPTILAVFGLPIFSYLLLRSKVVHRRGKVSWKGRSYDGGRATTIPVP